jgi:hypothetical protein
MLKSPKSTTMTSRKANEAPGNGAPTRFEAKLEKIGSLVIIQLPKSASARLPSRGMVMVQGTINGAHFQSALEPDGRGGHWFKVDKTMREASKAGAGDAVTLEVEPIREWPEPAVPADLNDALARDTKARDLWIDITPIARWDWIRWINATKNPDTRKIRIEKTLSKLKAGKRTACCFNRSQCTDVDVSKNGILLVPAATVI